MYVRNMQTFELFLVRTTSATEQSSKNVAKNMVHYQFGIEMTHGIKQYVKSFERVVFITLLQPFSQIH